MIRKRIGRICRSLITASAVCLMSVSRREAESSSKGRVVDIFSRAPLESGAPGSHRPHERLAFGPVAIINRVIGAFPLPGQPVQPTIYREYLAYNAKIKKEVVLEFGVKCITAKPAPPRPERGSEWFHKSGLESPLTTLNLARDDLDSVPATA